MDKYLFLDIDGCLNNDTYSVLWRDYRLYNYKSFFKYGVLDPHNVIVLKNLVTKLPGINIVISSEWRYQRVALEELGKVFDQFGVPRWIDVTPIQEDWDIKNAREEEIKLYMKEHGIAKEQIVIIDDTNFYKELSDRFVKTYYKDGLTNKDADKVKQLFSEKVIKEQKLNEIELNLMSSLKSETLSNEDKRKILQKEKDKLENMFDMNQLMNDSMYKSLESNEFRATKFYSKILQFEKECD